MKRSDFKTEGVVTGRLLGTTTNNLVIAKPCPFCGGVDIHFTNHGKVSTNWLHRGDDVWSMCCYKCGATFPNRYSKELLVEAWNRRVK